MIPVVLCVDDDPTTQLINSFILADAALGERVETVSDGQAALDYFAAHPPCPTLVLLDINMPVLDGFGFLEAFPARFPEWQSCVRVMMVSSSIDPADHQRAQASPLVIGFVSKPINQAHLNSVKSQPFYQPFFQQKTNSSQSNN